LKITFAFEVNVRDQLVARLHRSAVIKEREMTAHFLDWNEHGIPEMQPVRDSHPARQLLIEACGFDRSGRFFTERTETSDVSESGCKFRLRAEINSDAILALRIIGDRNNGVPPMRPVLFRTVQTEKDSCDWIVAVSKLQQNDPWMANSPDTKDRRAFRAG